MTTDSESTTASEQAKAIRLAHHIGRMQGRQEQKIEQLRATNESLDRKPQEPRLNQPDVRMDTREAWRDPWIERMEARFDRMEAKLDLLAWIMGAAIVVSIANVALDLFQKLS